MVEAGSPRWSRFWLRVRQLGFLGFLFFLIKGLLWLIVPAVVIWWRSRNG
ncbi:MAG: alanyl-tRNA synthetase [Candidatus Eisenbacteria bacterium]|uniref:Alanyl-tRNA synthetase n=1 Tax=Eiseniibacteriota bacterium TaxID=2212470 RepID=A0A849SF58_UNCEI|nr:alanyl-tRNA synthetase [Candidatus Eisenbacteria bacterium]